MADEIKDENVEESDELESQESKESKESQEPQSEAADEENLADVSEEQKDEEPAEFQRSASEILAEQAMLAELEASANEEEPEDVFPVSAEDSILPEKIKNLDLLLDVSLNVTVELGRKEMRFGEVLNLGKGSLVELNKIADEPVDIYVNQSKIAEGEVVVVDDHFGVRITRLVVPNK